jgi:hypothetical protein
MSSEILDCRLAGSFLSAYMQIASSCDGILQRGFF